ncbi:hypothetical protein B0T16DRAFT_308355, partial [Cercophora newfieldiana]
LLQNFNAALDADIMEYCPRCKEKWFDMGMRQGFCKRCNYRDNNKRDDEPYFFSSGNKLDFGAVPDHLPSLTQVEEQLIARVHVHVDVYCVRGQQYKYKGHVTNFLRDVGSVYTQL